MKQSISLLTLFLSLSFLCSAQESVLWGKVTNQVTGESIPGAHIFIPNTSYQTYADSTGKFILPKLPLGYWQVRAFSPGFKMMKMDIQLEKTRENQDIQLNPETDFLPKPIKLSDKKRERLVAEFIYTFLGIKSIESQKNLTLLNPEVLIFSDTEKETQVSANEGLYFQNQNTGYLVTAYIEPFILDEKGVVPQAEYTYFELKPNSAEDQKRIQSTQIRLFENSLEYQMIRLLSGETDEFTPSPEPKVFYGDSPGEYKLTFKQPLVATLPNGGKVTLSYSGENVLVKSSGALTHPEDLIIEGVIESHSPVFYLPNNFEGEKIVTLKNLEKTSTGMQERIYLHTDRGYYWPDESILFKAYIRYGNAVFMDELSKVLHVELLDDKGYSIAHQVLQIENGQAQGFFEVDQPLAKGNYMLKAYTAWSTNYGDEGAFHQPFQILDWDDFPPQSKLEPISEGVSFFSDKSNYGPNESVTLNILTHNQEGRPVSANLSVSVLDLNQSQAYPEPKSIAKALELIGSDFDISDAENSVEFGFSLEGAILGFNDRPSRANVEVLINGFDQREEFKTDSEGAFTLSNRQFEGEFEIAIKATPVSNGSLTSKSLDLKTYGKTITLPQFEYQTPVLGENSFLSPEEIRAGMEIDEILMEEAVVESIRERRDGPMPYGTPTNIVDPSELQLNGDTQQFLFLLASKVPGMRVGGTPLSVSFRGGEPLVLVNGVPAALAGTPVIDVLSQINVFSIERIEIVRRLVTTLGDQGRNGVISIITKTGEDRQEALMASMNSFESFTFQGFPTTEALKLQMQKINDPSKEQRPVLYWNPNLITRESNLSHRIEFTSSKLGGPMWIEIRGMTDFGEPIYGRFLINED